MDIRLPFSAFKRLLFPLFLILCIGLVGTTGYMIIEGFPLFDAFYMTVITVSTVGYSEVHPLSDAGRLFTSFLIVVSFGTFAYAITSISQYVIGGEINRYLKGYKMNTAIQNLKDHVIVCGYGRYGRQAANELKNSNITFIVIEDDQQKIEGLHEAGLLFIKGDATRDEVLKQAHIGDAKALITTLPDDANNLFIVFSARAMNSSMLIISRAASSSSDKKLKIAGANNVIMPDKIGGTHMASLVVNPDVIEFIDYITGQGGISTYLAEISCQTLRADLMNKSLRELQVHNSSGANIIGLKTAEGDFVVNPSPDTPIASKAKIFVLGSKDQMEKLREMLFS